MITDKLREYVGSRKPLGECDVLEVSELPGGESSSHANYKIRTSRGDFIARAAKDGEGLSYANLADEFTILKLVEKYDVGPKAVALDLEHFVRPVLFEEFIDGELYSNVKNGTDEMYEAAISLLLAVSRIDLDRSNYPFKYSYTTYDTNFRTWEKRLGDIDGALGEENDFTRKYREVAQKAQAKLSGAEPFLVAAHPEFIYNDVHRGNLIYAKGGKRAVFIDWQKVSLGDPSFMAALFARRFGSLWGLAPREFEARVLTSYAAAKNIKNFEKLLNARMLERAVSDMIWITWASIKRGAPVQPRVSQDNVYLEEAEERLSLM